MKHNMTTEQEPGFVQKHHQRRSFIWKSLKYKCVPQEQSVVFNTDNKNECRGMRHAALRPLDTRVKTRKPNVSS